MVSLGGPTRRTLIQDLSLKTLWLRNSNPPISCSCRFDSTLPITKNPSYYTLRIGCSRESCRKGNRLASDDWRPSPPAFLQKPIPSSKSLPTHSLRCWLPSPTPPFSTFSPHFPKKPGSFRLHTKTKGDFT